jgi:hypothetical protein
MDGGAAGANLHNNAIYTKQASGLGHDPLMAAFNAIALMSTTLVPSSADICDLGPKPSIEGLAP